VCCVFQISRLTRAIRKGVCILSDTTLLPPDCGRGQVGHVPTFFLSKQNAVSNENWTTVPDAPPHGSTVSSCFLKVEAEPWWPWATPPGGEGPKKFVNELTCKALATLEPEPTQHSKTTLSGQTPDKEVKISHLFVHNNGYIEPIRLPSCLPTTPDCPAQQEVCSSRQSGQTLPAVSTAFKC
jgi:hypothetical protein